MKKILKITLLLVLFVNMMIPVCADLIVTPSGDDFFSNHEDEMDIAVNYYVKADKKVFIHENPESQTVKGTIEEGRVLHLSYTYEDENGTIWGMQVLSNDQCAWFKLDDMSDFYWNWTFCYEHESELHGYGSQNITYNEDGWLVLWEYPGSDMVSGTIKSKETRTSRVTAGWFYDDENGVRWLNINYKDTEGWLNTNEPLQKSKPQVMDVYLDPSDISGTLGILETGVLVAAVCIGTGILIVIKRKRPLPS